MEELIIQKNKNTQYLFCCDTVVIKNKEIVKQVIKKADIVKLFYNPKFRAKDFLIRILVVLFSRHLAPTWNCPILSNSLNIHTVNNKTIKLKITPSDYEKVKQILQIKEVGLSGDF